MNLNGYNLALDENQKHTSRKIFYGDIIKVDQERQTITVESPAIGKLVTVPINNHISYPGCGIRYMPIVKNMMALIIKDGMQDEYYHIGYYFKDAYNYTDNRFGTKNTAVLPQRFLEQGEVQLVSRRLNEVFLSADGSVYIKSGDGQYLNLSDIDSLFEGYFGTLHFEMENVRIRAGNARRPIDLTDDTESDVKDNSTHVDGYVLKNSESNIPEFTVSVGAVSDEDGIDLKDKDEYTGIDLYPTVGVLSISDQVLDSHGNPEKVLDKELKALAKFPAGVSLSVDEEGSFVLLDQANNNFIRFKTGIDPDDDSIPLTEIEIKLNNINILIQNDSVTYIDNHSNQITLTEDETIIQSTNTLKLMSNGGGSEEKSVLGETLKDLLSSFLNKVATHNHTGPVGPPANAADFITLDSVDLQNILSEKTKNN